MDIFSYYNNIVRNISKGRSEDGDNYAFAYHLIIIYIVTLTISITALAYEGEVETLLGNIFDNNTQKVRLVSNNSFSSIDKLNHSLESVKDLLALESKPVESVNGYSKNKKINVEHDKENQDFSIRELVQTEDTSLISNVGSKSFYDEGEVDQKINSNHTSSNHTKGVAVNVNGSLQVKSNAIASSVIPKTSFNSFSNSQTAESIATALQQAKENSPPLEQQTASSLQNCTGRFANKCRLQSTVTDRLEASKLDVTRAYSGSFECPSLENFPEDAREGVAALQRARGCAI